jgi:hypothetical protein
MISSKPLEPGSLMIEFCLCPNLDFEYELAAGQNYRQRPQLEKLCDRWQAILRLLPGCEDAELGPKDGQVIVPWGVTPKTERLSAAGVFPPSSLVKLVNDKRFSHRLEMEFGCALVGSRIVEDLDDLDAAVESCSHDWVLKHPFGVGGRERVTGKKGQGFADACRWAENRIQKGWSLVFEPWAYQRTEFSFHYQIEQTGPIEFLGHCGLVSDESGAFRGNRVVPSDPARQAFLTITDKAVERLAELGYWGPVSIDAFLGTLGQAPVSRPIMEINARYSFGRMALELVRRIPQGWCLHWWHPKARCRPVVEKLARDYPDDSQSLTPGIYRLPLFADPDRRTGSYLVVAPEAALLDDFISGP